MSCSEILLQLEGPLEASKHSRGEAIYRFSCPIKGKGICEESTLANKLETSIRKFLYFEVYTFFFCVNYCFSSFIVNGEIAICRPCFCYLMCLKAFILYICLIVLLHDGFYLVDI